MIIRRAEESDIRAALDVANYQFDGNLAFKELEDRSGPRVPRYKIRLTVRDLDGPGCRRGFLSYYGDTDAPRRIRSACYHACGAFMVALLERVPDAIIESGAMHLQGGRYRGARGFLLNFAAVGENNVGSLACPVPFDAACNCYEHDIDFIDIETLVYRGYEFHIPRGGESVEGA